MIADEIIEQVREAADIVAIIGEYVPLKKTGSDYRGPCPFHQGTRRNFSVVPAKRLYHCFVCGESGDVFKFLTKRLGVEWPVAVRMVGEKAGIDVPESKVRRDGPDPREPLWELQATAAAYFQKTLWEESVGAQAREYLAERDISRAVAEDFGIGFAPREIGLMRGYMNGLGFDDARLLEGGLMVQPDGDTEPRPRFRSRLMFPILDAMGRNVGFGGRLLGPGEPKYLNSSESPIFSKGKLLWGLNRSRNQIRRADRALIVEGYFDALRLMISGIEEVVAPLGTALTESQAGLLKKYSKNVYLLYDSDAAGLKATFRAGDELLSQGFSVRVVTLPAGEDPDTFVRTQGAAEMEAQLSKAIDVFERKIQILERGGWFAELQKKRRALDRLLPTIRATSDEIMKDLYVGRASEVTGVAREILIRELGSTRAPAHVVEPPAVQVQALAPGRPPQAAPRIRRDSGSSAEEMLVLTMLQDRSLVDTIAERIGEESFRNPSLRMIFKTLLEKGETATVDDLAASLEGDSIALLQDLLMKTGSIVEVNRTIEDSIAKLHNREIENKMARLKKLLTVATDVQRTEIEAELSALNKERTALGRGSWGSMKSRSR
ncbi:MAG TPA: DNA primase [Gemmatimonadaceae bacterium]|nr:DNA primase [Gemmatimonadaceae bacterium]